MSGEIGITTLVRGDNDMVVFAESGVTLFEGSAANDQLYADQRIQRGYRRQ